MNIYETALASSNACNMSGVLFSFDRLLGELAQTVSPEELPNHPAVIVFVQALENMANVYGEEPIAYSRNLLDTVKEFTDYMHLLCEQLHGTDQRNQHPAVKAYVRILLGIVPVAGRFYQAMDECEQLV